MIDKIVKRDGRQVEFDQKKIADAIFKAAQSIGGKNYETANELATQVVEELEKELKGIEQWVPKFYPMVMKQYEATCAGSRDLFF